MGLKRAFSAVIDAFRTQPASRASHRDIGDSARDAKRWVDAAQAYRIHLEGTPDDVAIWVQLGHALKESGDRDGAGLAYGAALALAPDDADLLLNMGHLARLSGRPDQAADYYMRSYASDANAHAHHQLRLPEFADHLDAAAIPLMLPLKSRAASSWDSRLAEVGEITIDGLHVSGWAIDPSAAGEPAWVDVFADGALVATACCDRFCVNLLGTGHPALFAGFRILLPPDLAGRDPVIVTARLTDGGRELGGSGVATVAPRHLRRWLQRSRIGLGDERDALVSRAQEKAGGLTLSIVMPVYNTDPAWLAEALESVIGQWCGQWELICVDDCSPRPEPRGVLSEFARRDPRIKPIFLSRNGGISVAVNAGIAAASGDYVGFLDHDDCLEPDAVAEMLSAAAQSGADLLYSDEAVTGDNINLIKSIAARPAFSHDYYLSHPYFVHFVCVRTALAQALGYDEDMTISADVDFVLRAIERADRVAHVPAILYRWRTHAESAGHAAKDRVTDATVAALNRHLQRLGLAARATAGLHFNSHKIEYADPGGKVGIVIPTKNQHELVRACVASIRRTTDPADVEILIVDHDSDEPASRAYFASLAGECRVIGYSGPFNFAAINNFAVAQLSDAVSYVLFCNNDIEAIDGGWLERMRSIAARPDVGVVGATLLYPDRTIQHAGVIVPLVPLADHAHKRAPFENEAGRNPGYNGCLTSLRDYSAVTAACMMMRRDLFHGVGGFDPAFAIGFNDTDLCLRVGGLGYKILNDAYAVLYHHESATRQITRQVDHPEDAARLMTRWIRHRSDGDPFYSPLLSPFAGSDHHSAPVEGFWKPARVRAVRPGIGSAELARPDAYTGSK